MDFLYDDDDDEILLYLAYLKQLEARRPRRIRPRPDHLGALDDVEFQKQFRMSKETFWLLHSKIEHLIQTKTMRNHALSSVNRLLLTLRYYATGCFMKAVGDFSGVSKSTASVVIASVTCAINTLKDEYIKFPNAGVERSRSSFGFYSIAKFPKVVGAIDCTHIPIVSPGGEDAEFFRNSKNFFSLKVQTVSDYHLKIVDFVSRWPGSSLDQTVFDHSTLKARLESNEFEGGLILGDVAYENKKYFVTPLSKVSTNLENLFNESQIRTCYTAQRTYGVWKNRFPILFTKMRHEVLNTRRIILSTVILHNLCIDQKDMYPFSEEEFPCEESSPVQSEDEDEEEDEAEYEREDDSTRKKLLAGYFTKLSKTKK